MTHARDYLHICTPEDEAYRASLDQIGEPIANGADHTADAPPKFSRVINPAELEGCPIPLREWIVPDWILHKTVTLLYGDGAIGKSLLALQLCAGMALARDWIGLLPHPGRSLLLSAEDDAEEMHRRLENIRKFYGARMVDLANIRFVDLVGEDSVLGTLMHGQIKPTSVYHALDRYISEWNPILTVLDVLADMFSGDENNRPQARQFIGLLKRLARKHDCAFLLLAHPSLTGLNSGTGTSGTTGWNNAVRSRLYFQTAKASDGSEPDKNLRTLECKKSNYGRAGATITLEWKNGLFVPVKELAGLDKMAADAKAEEVFLSLLKRFNAQGRNAGVRKGTSYAPALFAEEPDHQGISKAQFAAAMTRLLAAEKIRIEETGPPSRRSQTLVPTPKGDGAPAPEAFALD